MARWLLWGVLACTVVGLENPRAVADPSHGGVYQRSRHAPHSKPGRGHQHRGTPYPYPAQVHFAPRGQFTGGYYQRPYPYHLDYYRMRYGGSYAPYFGNLYGTPQVYAPGSYYGGYFAPQVGYPAGYGNGAYGPAGQVPAPLPEAPVAPENGP